MREVHTYLQSLRSRGWTFSRRFQYVCVTAGERCRRIAVLAGCTHLCMLYCLDSKPRGPLGLTNGRVTHPQQETYCFSIYNRWSARRESDATCRLHTSTAFCAVLGSKRCVAILSNLSRGGKRSRLGRV